MSTDPNQPSSDQPSSDLPLPDEPDPKKQSTPAGIVQDLEEEAEEVGASTEPSSQQGQPTAT